MQLALSATSLVVVSAAMTLLFVRQHRVIAAAPPSPMQQLASAMTSANRAFDARFSGLPPVGRAGGRQLTNATSVDALQLRAVAEELSSHLPDPEAAVSREAAISSLLLKKEQQALTAFEGRATSSPGDAERWNDLAAARVTIAIASDAVDQLPLALSEVDRALEQAPALSAARWNRALILQHLGIRDAAAREWQKASQLRDAFAAQAATRARQLQPPQLPRFPQRLNVALSAARRLDTAPLRALTRAEPQLVRAYGEGPLFTVWANAVSHGEHAAALASLDDLRHVGEELARKNQDALIGDCVRAIDAAANAPARLRRLADAHLAYDAARRLYSRNAPRSDVMLSRAAALFAATCNPMKAAARYYAANATFDRNGVREARSELLSLETTVDAKRYPSLAAGVQWELGLIEARSAIWSDALRHLERAHLLYRSLGEEEYSAAIASMQAEVQDRLGAYAAGWQARREVLDVLTHGGDPEQIALALAGGMYAESARGRMRSALSLAALARDAAARSGNLEIGVELALRLARVEQRLGHTESAQQRIAEARASLPHIGDERVRERVSIATDLAEGEIGSRIALRTRMLLTRAIGFYRRTNPMLLPSAYLVRGRAAKQMKDRVAAHADFDRGLEYIERQRRTVLDPALRQSVFDVATELLQEAIALDLARGDTSTAFTSVERTRGRTLRELVVDKASVRSVSAANIIRFLPAGTLLIEYELLPEGLVIFTIDRNGLDVARTRTPPAQIASLVQHFTEAAEQGRDIATLRSLGAQLHALLIAPVAAREVAAERLIIVPDRSLHLVPFAALVDRTSQHYLIEDHELLIVPSATSLLAEHRSAAASRQTLVIADPARGAARLEEARNEAIAVARIESPAILLSGTEATAARFTELAPHCAIVHYSGHAWSDAEEGGVLPLAVSADAAVLDTAAISHLNLAGIRLVVLAACATLRGSATRLEGMPSLARAFLAAGARSVIGTLWNIDDDASAQLFVRVHERIHAGDTPSESLRAAQRQLLRSDDARLRSPAVWAAAELIEK